MDDHHPIDEEEENRRSTSVRGWPSSRIVRVSRASGGKDRHSKVLTSKGPRDRRVRLSVNTAIQFYDLQDRLGYDQPSKAVEWLLTAAASSIAELPAVTAARGYQLGFDSGELGLGGRNSVQLLQEAAKSPAGSSNSETSKGSGISIVRSENDNECFYVSSFSELLSGKINCTNKSVHQIASSAPLFSATADHHSAEVQHFSFHSDNSVPVNSPRFTAVNRGTLQSNISQPPMSSFPPPPNFFTGAAVPSHNHHISALGSTPACSSTTAVARRREKRTDFVLHKTGN